MLDLPHNVQVPVLRLLRLVAETLEGDPHLDFVPPVRDATARLEDVVRTQIGLLAADYRTADEAAGADVGALDQRAVALDRSEEHTSELQSHSDLVCRLLLEKKNE